jgi:hypothetical protein
VTSPPPPPDVQAQLDLFLVHAAELYALERLASKTVVGPLRTQLALVHRRAAALWVTLFGALDARSDPIGMSHLVTQVKRDLRDVDPAVAGRLAEYADKALRMGVRHAGDEIQVRPVIRPPESGTSTPPPAPRRPGHGTPRRDWPTVDVDPVLNDTAVKVMATLDADVQAHLAEAERSLDRVGGDTYGAVTDALVPSQKAITTADRATTIVVNKASNSGSDAVSEALDAERLWLAERDACLGCLAYAGQVAPVGESFPIGLTFGRRPITPWPDPHFLDGPELHPHCRCRTTPWLGHVEGAPGPSLPEVLKREAQRSVLKGWRMESEPETARLAAADRLLARGVNAPKSVKNYARTAIKRGHFPSNTVPAGNR